MLISNIWLACFLVFSLSRFVVFPPSVTAHLDTPCSPPCKIERKQKIHPIFNAHLFPGGQGYIINVLSLSYQRRSEATHFFWLGSHSQEGAVFLCFPCFSFPTKIREQGIYTNQAPLAHQAKTKIPCWLGKHSHKRKRNMHILCEDQNKQKKWLQKLIMREKSRGGGDSKEERAN